MAQIRITPEELRGIELQIRSLVAEQETLTAKTRSVLDALKSSWQGDVVDAADNELRSLLENDLRKNDVLKNLADQASKTSQIMEDCDASIASAFRE